AQTDSDDESAPTELIDRAQAFREMHRASDGRQVDGAAKAHSARARRGKRQQMERVECRHDPQDLFLGPGAIEAKSVCTLEICLDANAVDFRPGERLRSVERRV